MRRAGLGATHAGGRIGGRVVRGLAIAYINFFRARAGPAGAAAHGGQLPVPADPGDRGPDRLPDRRSSALGLVYAAYIAEVYRAGIESVDRGQTEAARSLGMSAAPDDAAGRSCPRPSAACCRR